MVTYFEKEKVLAMLEKVPVIKQEENKAKWIYVEDGDRIRDTYRCSKCNKKIKVDNFWTTDLGIDIQDMKYCPHCGKQMEN